MPPKRYGLKIALGIGIAVLLCYLLFALRASRSAANELALARKEGLWTTLDDLADRPAPPAARNAALIYQPLCASLTAAHLVKGGALDPTVSSAGEPAFEAIYLRAEPYLKEFERAAAMPDCQFQRDWRAGEAVLFPELSEIKTAFTIVCTEATMLGRHGRAAQGLDLIRRFAPMAAHVGSDPTLIAPLVQIAMNAVAFRAIQTILGANGLDSTVLARAKAAVAALGPPPDPIGSIRGECAMTTGSMADPAFWSGNFSENGRLALLSHIPAVRDQWKADLVRAYRDVYATLRTTQPHAGVTIGRLERLGAGYSEVTDALMPSRSQWYVAIVHDASERAALRVLIAGLESWQISGKPPSVLPVTDPAVVDPRTEKPFRFAKIPGGFKVWGVGRDGVDHGGVAYVPGERRASGEFDTVYSYPYRPQRRPVASR